MNSSKGTCLACLEYKRINWEELCRGCIGYSIGYGKLKLDICSKCKTKKHLDPDLNWCFQCKRQMQMED